MRLASAFFKKLVSFNVFFMVIILCLLLLVIYNGQEHSKYNVIREVSYDDSLNYESNPKFHADVIDSYLNKRTDWLTSNLGAILFKNIPINNIPRYNSQENRTFVILIWKYWKWLENRHVYSFNMQRNSDPLQKCSVKNCKFTGDDKTLSTADAVIVHVQKGELPNTTLRNTKQRWVFLSDESPMNSFSLSSDPPSILDLADIFNWSMTYRVSNCHHDLKKSSSFSITTLPYSSIYQQIRSRSNSDVPVPYGRTIPLKKQILNQITDKSLASLIPNWNNKRTDVLVSILISNCGVSRRMEYLQELQEHMTIDVYGKCSKDKKTSCPGHFKSDCKQMSEYFFYLVFENSQCDEYLTEKSFYHAYGKGAIPVIMGPSIESCEILLPPNSFLHVDEFINPKALAKHLTVISKSRKKLLSFHIWRNDFYVANEHGFFGTKSFHFCRICEALNYNDQEEKHYDEDSLRLYFDPDVSCQK